MKTRPLIAVLAFLAVPLASFGQATQDNESRRIPAAKDTSQHTPAASPQYGQGGSPHCDSLSGPEKDQCLKDEGAKTDSKATDSAAGGATSSAARGPAPGGENDAEHSPTK